VQLSLAYLVTMPSISRHFLTSTLCACLYRSLPLQKVAFSLSLIVEPDLHITGTIMVVYLVA
jgi:hypothetical protein